MKPARFLLPISVLILGMSQSALAEKDGTAETVEAEKKGSAGTLGRLNRGLFQLRTHSDHLRLRYVSLWKCGNQRG